MPNPYADSVSIGILVKNGVSGAYADPWSSGRHRTFLEKRISDPYENPASNEILVENEVSEAFVDVQQQVKMS